MRWLGTIEVTLKNLTDLSVIYSLYRVLIALFSSLVYKKNGKFEKLKRADQTVKTKFELVSCIALPLFMTIKNNNVQSNSEIHHGIRDEA